MVDEEDDHLFDDRALRMQRIDGLAYRFFVACKQEHLTWREAAATACSLVEHLAKKRPEDRAAICALLSLSLGRVREMTEGTPDA
jgi:hypothetical protein